MPVSTKSEAAKSRTRNQVLAAAAVSTLAATSASQAALVFPTYEKPSSAPVTQYLGPVLSSQNTVATGNSFQIAVVGFDITDESSTLAVNDAAFLVGPVTVTFGTTKTVTAATIDGETLTITSAETVSKGVTTDKITFSVPTRFAPIGTTFTDGDLIDEEDLELGFDAGSGLQLSYPVTTTITASGTALYGSPTKHTTYTFSAKNGSAPYTYLDPTDTILSADEGLETLTTAGAAADITPYNFSSFSFTFAYTTPAVPEPATGAVAMVLGSLGLMRRRRNRAEGSTVDLSTGLIDDGASEMLAAAPAGVQTGAAAASIDHASLV